MDRDCREPVDHGHDVRRRRAAERLLETPQWRLPSRGTGCVSGGHDPHQAGPHSAMPVRPVVGLAASGIGVELDGQQERGFPVGGQYRLSRPGTA